MRLRFNPDETMPSHPSQTAALQNPDETPPELTSEQQMVSAQDMAEKAVMAAGLLKALSHEGRLMILCHLAEGELCVSDLEKRLEKRQATVSQLLARLREDGLVRTRRDGKTVYYTLEEGPAKSVLGVLHAHFCGL